MAICEERRQWDAGSSKIDVVAGRRRVPMEGSPPLSGTRRDHLLAPCDVIDPAQISVSGMEISLPVYTPEAGGSAGACTGNEKQ